jgi:hypothetical protein
MGQELVFTDYGQASMLAGWVRRHAEKSMSDGRTFNNRSGEGLVPFRKNQDECDRDDPGKSTYARAKQ